MRYLIQPLNEGQELNYSEIKDFKSIKEARQYAFNLKCKLALVLSEGIIDVTVEKNEI